MRPSREAFEEMLDALGDERLLPISPEKADALAAFDAQEATIRELADALEALLAYTLTSTSHSSGKLFDHVREVLARARGGQP